MSTGSAITTTRTTIRTAICRAPITCRRRPTAHRLRTRKDVRPGAISFYDPRGPAVNMGAIRDDPYVNPEHTVQPKAGEILLWPAFLTHFVHPNLSETPRISISFNVVLKWRDDYLPRQD